MEEREQDAHDDLKLPEQRVEDLEPDETDNESVKAGLVNLKMKQAQSLYRSS